MTTHLLTEARARDAARPRLRLAPGVDFPLARLHEACGPARRMLAMWLATALPGPVIWIAPAWTPDQPHADGIADFTDPGRFLFVRPARAEDLLWTMEEVLRSGAVAFVVADLPGPPGLTPVRRLHLAAETGAGAGAHRPLGLILTPGEGGAQGIETRWHMAPCHSGRRRLWRLDRLRARGAPPAIWQVAQDRPGTLPHLCTPSLETA